MSFKFRDTGGLNPKKFSGQGDKSKPAFSMPVTRQEKDKKPLVKIAPNAGK